MKEKFIRYLMNDKYIKIDEINGDIKINFYIPTDKSYTLTSEMINYFTSIFPAEFEVFRNVKIRSTFYCFEEGKLEYRINAVVETIGDSVNLYICSVDSDWYSVDFYLSIIQTLLLYEREVFK